MIVDTKTGSYTISKQIRKKYSVDYDGSRDFKKGNKKNFDKETWKKKKYLIIHITYCLFRISLFI